MADCVCIAFMYPFLFGIVIESRAAAARSEMIPYVSSLFLLSCYL